jgi:polysaccharide deacetylase 2 family uncharacterized protein YibQ
MSEQFNVGYSDTPSVMLLNAMAALAPDNGDIQSIFNLKYGDGKCMVDLELSVNGVVIPFKESIQDAWKALEATLDEEILKRAMELVSKSRLDKLQMALDNVEWQIEDALRAALEKKG